MCLLTNTVISRACFMVLLVCKNLKIFLEFYTRAIIKIFACSTVFANTAWEKSRSEMQPPDVLKIFKHQFKTLLQPSK